MPLYLVFSVCCWTSILASRAATKAVWVPWWHADSTYRPSWPVWLSSVKALVVGTDTLASFPSFRPSRGPFMSSDWVWDLLSSGPLPYQRKCQLATRKVDFATPEYSKCILSTTYPCSLLQDLTYYFASFGMFEQSLSDEELRDDQRRNSKNRTKKPQLLQASRARSSFTTQSH